MSFFSKKRHQSLIKGYNTIFLKFITITLLSTTFILGTLLQQALGTVTIQTVWGECTFEHPIFKKIIEHNTLQRLKYVDQSGPITYFGYMPYFNRYEHSIGVLALLQKANAPLNEQVAGLLHDVSHTVFSHIADHLLYKSNLEKSYQDTIHLKFLKTMHVQKVTEPYGIFLKDLDPDNPSYSALEQPLPNLCADRIQYLLHTGVIVEKISCNQAKMVIDNLKFQDGIWFFLNKKPAKIIGMLSLEFTQELYGAPWNFAFYEYFTEILKEALKIKLITLSEIKYGTDKNVLHLLESSNNKFINKGMEHLKDVHNIFKEYPFGQGELNIKPKFRGVDPLIKVGENFVRLSAIDPNFKEKFEEVKKWCNTGYGIRFVITK
ncbi:phosphohydrolase [Lawsonia intracellularis]|uniref:HD domain-containing protein n=1 Tax=Lawsonia intracellularis TaxID=29546 RepID=UPI000976DB3E|nr:HD domain-containing protein [Lawsonia intracellularis]OMQ02005.1 phosphohydrolase [Lawsonia intracellularis]